MFSKAWFTATLERVISTAAAAWLGVLTGEGLTDNVDLTVEATVTVVGVAALVSFLKAIVASKTGDSASPSFANEVLEGEVIRTQTPPADPGITGTDPNLR